MSNDEYIKVELPAIEQLKNSIGNILKDQNYLQISLMKENLLNTLF